MLGEHHHIARPRAQRRQRHHLEGQAVEQIGAELMPRRPCRADARWWPRRCGHRRAAAARIRSASPRHIPPRATAGPARPSRACQARRGTACRHRASSKRPARVLVAPVKAPASWPNNSASISVSGSAAQFMMTNGLVPARAQAVEPLGDQLLAGAALADHQHRPVERGRAARALQRVEKGPD